ncbi:MAG: AAA family ATPase, partial [Aeriscardovia sp.]|nr:AAA family ATPase [Aeriscardovia sp.]
MRLERIRIRNYRSIEDLTIYFPPNKPVILFGSNNAGKSNILSAILNLRRFDPRYAVEPQWRPIANGASVYDTSSSNDMLMMKQHLDSLTEKFTNSGAPSRGCDSTTEITLTVDLRDRKEQVIVGFIKCGSDDYLPYVKNKRVLLNLPLPANREISFIQVWESGSGDPSYYLDYLKTTRGENNNGSPEWFLKLLPEIAKKVSDSIKGIKEFDRFPQGKGENAPADLFFVGSGQQSWVGRFGDLAAASVIKSAVDDLQLVLMDEPETHLHPNAEAQLWEKIQTASEDGVQVILTTHSENFLCMEDLEGFVRVYKENGVTKACQLTKTELNSTLDKNFGGVENYYSVH